MWSWSPLSSQILNIISCRQTGNMVVTSWKGHSLLCCNNDADSMRLLSAYTSTGVMCCGMHVQSLQRQSLRASAPSCPRIPRQSWPGSCCSWPRQPNTPRFAMCTLSKVCVNHSGVGMVLSYPQYVFLLGTLTGIECILISLACNLISTQ